MDKIIQEKISADHLFYVSLKYTKTCDVMVNLILRWRDMIEHSFDKLLLDAKKKKKIKAIPVAPKPRIEILKNLFKKEEDIMDVIGLYEVFRVIEDLKKSCENEFRKNVTLRLSYKGEIIQINMDTLKEYADILERFISYMKQFLSSKK